MTTIMWKLPSTEGKLLAQLKNETILRELTFDEENRKISYVKDLHLMIIRYIGQLQKYI